MIAQDAIALPVATRLDHADSFAANMNDSDHELMLSVRDGDIDRLGDLFERHHRPLYGFLVNMSRDRALAEDLTQQVFLRILKYRHTYRDDGKFSAWMYHLARMVLADHIKRSNHAASPIASDPQDLHAVADEAPHAAEATSRRDDLSLMQTALDRLSPAERELISLHRFQNLPHDEIAGLLKCSVGAVKVRLHRAIASLKDQFFKLRQESPAQ